MNITDRQKSILMAVIEEYMDNAKEVGSTLLMDKYDFRISSATIRNEMVKLMDMGYLAKSHISSGRVPTDLAFRLYVNERVGKSMKDSLGFVQIRQGLFSVRFYPEKMIKTLLQLLVEYCQAASFVVMDDMSRYYGVSSLMNYDELRSIEQMRRIIDLLEDENLLKGVFSRYQDSNLTVLIGSELGIKDLEQCTMVFTKFDFWGKRSGYFGVVGSKRMEYAKVIPTLLSVQEAVHESLKGWR